MTKARAKQRSQRPAGGRAAPRTPAREPAPASAPDAATPDGPPAPTPIRFLPSALALAMIAYALIAEREPGRRWAIVGAAAVIAAWSALLLRSATHRARGLAITVEARRQHYMQVFSQAIVFAWWGWHLPFPLVRDHVPMLAVQLAFAYGFDLLLSWTRHGRYTLGFGPFPVIFSINLFLWFTPDWFFLQFVIIAVGFAAKDLIRWQRDGRRVHIFNPSSFPLALASLVMIVTASTDVSYGETIANSQNNVSYMYLVLFLVALPGQFLFGVATMSMSAIATTYLFGLLYLAFTGTYFFIDCYIPVSVFLGMLLLVTDPSTAPRSELGRIIFGAMYGLFTVLLYWVLLSAGVPPFYDKLLQVPVMNLMVRGIDRIATTSPLAAINPERIARSLAPRLRYAAYASIWAAVFVTMYAVGGVGERHPGQYLPFWIGTCEKEGSERACAYVAVVAQKACGEGSGWACNEAAILGPRSSWGLDAPMDAARRNAAFIVGCNAGFTPACRNAAVNGSEHPRFERAPPTVADYKIVLRGSRHWSVPETEPGDVYARACAQGWPDACNHH